MGGNRSVRILDVSGDLRDALVTGALCQEPVSGLTHTFYRYPARFSPEFARSAIEAFTAPGDAVLDPFMGGGTVLVEALHAGREAAGIDISSLAHFIAGVKTRPLTPGEAKVLLPWFRRTLTMLSIRRHSVRPQSYIDAGYQKYLNSRHSWRLRKVLELYVERVHEIEEDKLRRFARCIVLSVAQWALDGRRDVPRLAEFRRRLRTTGRQMIADSVAFGLVVKKASKVKAPDPYPTCLNRSAVGLEEVDGLTKETPRLVLTSPPYPGVYVTYHRWKIGGRLETAAPFWLADTLDGAGLKYYTLGERREPQHKTYFVRIQESFASVLKVISGDTVVVQLLGFSDACTQLPAYLQAMRDAGYEEWFLPDIDSADGRLWREVPGRRWYAAYQSRTSDTAREVVLFHRPA